MAAAGVVHCGAVCAAVLLSVSPAAAATSLKVDVGYAGVYVPGQPVPIRVQVAADRLVSGDLKILADGVTTSAPIEVPGGSEKQFLVVVPTASGRTNLLNVSVWLPDGTKAPPTATQTAASVDDQEVVGLLPGALAGRSVPGPAPLSIDAGTARFVALGQAELDQAPDSLRALQTIGVGADELGRLASETRAAILRWVEGGGRLLVDAAPGTTVNGLPDQWQPGDQPRARAGAGEIRFTSGAMGAGRWANLIEPTPRNSPLNGSRIISGPPLGDSLARDAGFRLPQMSWLVAFLFVYVVVVGPVLFVVLRRRRRPELAWVVIPVVAVLFTGASWAGGRGLRDSTQMVHGTVLATGATGSTALTYLGVSSRSGGTVRIGWPTGWLAGANDAGSTQTVDLSGLRLTPAGPEGRLPLDANQFGVVSASGPAPAVSGALVITASANADGQATGVIRNTTKLHMERTAVFMGPAGTEVGPLGPGEERNWSLSVNNGGPAPEFVIMGRSPDGSSPTQFSLWDVAQRAGLADRDPGNAVALGWTSDYQPSVRVGGAVSRPSGKTLVVGTATVASGAPPAADLSFARDIVRTTQNQVSVYRFQVPTGRQASSGRAVDVDKLSLRSPILPLEVWTGDKWTSLSCNGCPPGAFGLGVSGTQTVTRCQPNGACSTTLLPVPLVTTIPVNGGGVSGEVKLPREAVRDGMIYVRFPQGGPNFAGDSTFIVRETA